MGNKNIKHINVLIFSFNRAMQLDATLRSLMMHCVDVENITQISVLYKASDEKILNQYKSLEAEYLKVLPIRFYEEKDFYKNTIEIISNQLSSSWGFPYLIELWRATNFTVFLVDDNLFVKPFSIECACDVLQKNRQILNFSLRLGINIIYSYTKDRKISQPDFKQLRENVLCYYWPQEDVDFGYPMDISSSVYRSSDILLFLKSIIFNSPNSLERNLVIRARKIVRIIPINILACYQTTVTFCAPINRVQNEIQNRTSKRIEFESNVLADYFSEGFRIDISKYSGFTPIGCHQEVDVDFIKYPDNSPR